MAYEQQPKGEAKEPEKDDEKNDSGFSKAFLEKAGKQVTAEFKHGDTAIEPWRAIKRVQLKLVLNQRKNTKKVGDTLMFATQQTVLAALFKDRQSAEWNGRNEEDIDRAEQVNAVYEFDYDQMGKAEHDYGKTFDFTGFGIAIEDWSHFDRDSLSPLPDLWDPLAFVIDPKATSINGNKLGRGAARFIYRTISRTMRDMEDQRFFNLKALKGTSDETSTATKNNEQARQGATGTAPAFDVLEENCLYELVQGYTWIDGKRYLVEAGKKGEIIVRLSRCKTDYWPLQDFHMYPDPHVFLTPGCWDFTEDKQRARAKLQNNTLDAAAFDVLPEFMFDKNKIKNKNQLREHKSGKWYEVDGPVSDAAMPMQKPTIHQYAQYIQQELEANAQKALATPEITQGVLFQAKQTATATAEQAANVDTRYGLTASIIGLYEGNAAMMWLDSYKQNFKKGIDKKMIRVVGPFGPTLTPITFDTFKFKADPDVKIESRGMSRARKREERENMTVFANLLLQVKGANIRSFVKDFGRLSFRKAVVDKYMPPTIDEMRAEQENELLADNKLEGVVDGMEVKVAVEPTDDDVVHLEVHGKAPQTKATKAHTETHKRSMMHKRANPELYAGLSPEGAPGGQVPGQPPTSASPQNVVKSLIQQ